MTFHREQIKTKVSKTFYQNVGIYGIRMLLMTHILYYFVNNAIFANFNEKEEIITKNLLSMFL